MGVIYEPCGKAKEYCDLAVNLYVGCSHGCIYCYAPRYIRKTREQFLKPYPRRNILIQVEKESPSYSGREIQLCFTCDPYQHLEEDYQITRQVLNIFTKHDVKARILTKGGMKSIRDIDLMVKNKSVYGATLTFVNESDSKHYEPYAALPNERFEALKVAKKAGLETWVSLEPVISPEQTIEIVHLTYEYVDTYKVGKLNHDSEAEKINWQKFLIDVTEVLKKYNKRYYIKKDLARFQIGNSKRDKK